MWLRLTRPLGSNNQLLLGGRQEVSLKAQCPERRT